MSAAENVVPSTDVAVSTSKHIMAELVPLLGWCAVALVADLADAAYATVSDAERLDLYEPATGDAPHPLVVIIHGGGWVTGDKRGDLPMAAIPGFLDRGYAVASINYRLTSEAIFPAQLLDAKAAIRFLRANAGDFDLDPDRIAVVGESAGAHLALLLGTTADVARFDDPAFGNGGVSSAVQAVVDFYGPADLATADTHRTLNPSCPSEPDPNIASLLGAPPAAAGDLAAAASPVSYLHPFQTLPPFFIAHGDADCIVPYQQSVELHEAIEAVAPGRSTLAIVPGSGHYPRLRLRQPEHSPHRVPGGLDRRFPGAQLSTPRRQATWRTELQEVHPPWIRSAHSNRSWVPSVTPLRSTRPSPSW